jgi:4-hydroxybenzoate polyprenyltransferase
MLIWRTRGAGFWRLLHPGPSLMTALAYLIFALIASQGHPPPDKLTLTTLGALSMQFAISTLNDYCDREVDQYSQKAKPIVQGTISARFALTLTLIFIVIMLACYASYGWGSTALAALSLSFGLAYDLGLKKTPFSGVVLGFAFPMIPLLAWMLFATLKSALFWTFFVGLVLGIGLHLADALPDNVADGRAGMRGLTQVLGDHALFVCWSLFATADLFMVVIALIGITPVRPTILLITVFLSILMLLAAIGAYHWRKGVEITRLRTNFRYIVVVALMMAIGWIAAAVV